MAFLAGYNFRKKLTIDSTKVDSNLTDFPVMVRLTNSNFDFTKAKADGSDIRFTSSDETTLLKFERELHDNIGEKAIYHIKVPTVDSGTDSFIYIYYGNSSATDDEDAINVWDSNYLAVWHMANLTTSTIEDSTTNGNDGTKTSAGNPDEVAGLNHKAQNISADNINVGDIDIDGDGTIEALVNPDNFGGSFGNAILACGDSGGSSNTSNLTLDLNDSTGEVEIQVGDNSSFQVFTSSLVSVTGSWQYVAGKADGGNLTTFLDTTSDSVAQTITPTSNNNNYRIGRFGDSSFLQFDGQIGEVRISDIARDNSWLKATRETLFDNLLTFGTEEAVTEVLTDVDLDIRTTALNLVDTDLDIRVIFPTAFADMDLDIRVTVPTFKDLNLDVRAIEQITKDLNLDIRTLASITKDVDLDIRTVFGNFSDISTDIRVSQITDTSQVQSNASMFFEEGFHLATNTVTINLDSVEGAIQMQFRNENESVFSTIEPYTPLKENFQLSPGDGDKTVFVRFLDIQGILSTGTDFIDAVVSTVTPPSVTIEAFTDGGATVSISDSTFQEDNTPFFRWNVPIFDIPYDGFSFALDATPNDDIDIALPDMVRDGIILTKATPSPEMTLETTDGTYYYALEPDEYTSQTVTLDDGGVLDRIDVIYISGGFGTLNIFKGTESATPLPPDLTVEAPDAIVLAHALVPAGTTLIANVTLTDKSERFIELNKFIKEPIAFGQHEFNVKGIVRTGLVSNVETFDIFISNPSPEMGTIDGFTDGTKTFIIQSGIYQTASDTPFFEWTAAPAEPGPIEYHYTTDGSEPTLASPFTTGTSISLGPFAAGVIVIKIKPFDTTSGFSGQTQEFDLVFGTETFTNDTAVIGSSTTLKQSDKTIQVKEISWDFNSARICKIFQPAEFDDTLPFSQGETISVVHGSSNTTVFTGRIIQIERSIDISQEGVLYHCVGPRGLLNECYAIVDDPDDPSRGDTAQILFEDVLIGTAITTIISKVPNIIKSVDSLPSGANISDEFIAQTISQVLDTIYSRTKFGWYVKPNGTLVSVDSTAVNSGEAKFGIYGTIVSSISPQFNVMSSNLQFDTTQRYNTAIIEGARRRERITVGAHCAGSASISQALDAGERDPNARFKIYEIDSDFPVVKIIRTSVSYSRLLGFQQIPQGAGGSLGFGDQITSWYIKFLKTEIAADNKITIRERQLQFINVTVPGSISKETPAGLRAPAESGTTDYTIKTAEVPQGSLGPNNTIRFSRPLWSLWPSGSHLDTTVNGFSATNTRELIQVGDGNTYAISNTWKGSPIQGCAGVSADVLIETFPLKVTVNVAGTASSNKILRIVREEFKFDEDPDNFRDDTNEMIQYATDALQKFKDIKINGSIVLDTIDLFWDLDNTINLINTQQGSWTSLDIKVIGINYNFDDNTTTLEVTSEFLK